MFLPLGKQVALHWYSGDGEGDKIEIMEEENAERVVSSMCPPD